MTGALALYRAEPFAGRPLEYRAAAGASLAEIVAVVPLPPSFELAGVICVNGDRVPRELWRFVRPKAHAIVTLHVAMQGFNLTKVLKTVAVVALVVAAIAVSSGAALGVVSAMGLGLGSAFAAGGWGAILGSTALSLGAALIAGGLTAPPTLPAATSASTVPTGSVSAASIAGNVIEPGGAAPRAAGTIRVFPPLAAQVLIETVNDDQFAEAVFVLGGPHALSAPGIGTPYTDLSTLPQVNYQLSDGQVATPIQNLITRYGFTNPNATELSGHQVDLSTQSNLLDQNNPQNSLPQWHGYTSKFGPDEIWINLNWPGGLNYNANPTQAIGQAFRVRFRRRGAVGWTNGPEIHFQHNRAGSIEKSIRLIFRKMPANTSLPPTMYGAWVAYKHVPTQTAFQPVGAGGWDADSYFSAGGGNDYLVLSTYDTTNLRNASIDVDRAIIWLDPATFPPDFYDVQVMRSQLYFAANFSASAYVYTNGPFNNVPDLFGYCTTSFVSPVIWRTLQDQSTFTSRVGISRFSSVWNQNPIQSRDFATLAIRVKNRTLDQVSVLASGYVYDWDGSGWNTITTTSNPAPQLYAVLTSQLSADPIPGSLIDDAELAAWRTLCINKNYTCNAILEGKSGDDVANMIASCGFAKPRRSNRWGVISDRDRSFDSIEQLFTPRNMANFRFERALPKLPHGFRVRFRDTTNDFVENQIVVRDPLAEPNPASLRLEDIAYDGLVTAADVTARATFDLAQGHFRFDYYYGDVPAENIRVSRGSLVGVQHDVLALRTAGAARIGQVQRSGGTITGLALDGTIPMPSEDAFDAAASAWSSYSSAWTTPRCGIVIRSKDGTFLTKEIVNAGAESNQITFAAAFTDPGGGVIDSDCLISSGVLGTETSRMLVFAIEYQRGIEAKMTFVPEAPQLWGKGFSRGFSSGFD